jgi:hypothetical protein
MTGSVDMDIDDLKIKGFLEELFRQTGRDTEARVSMYDVGSAIGLDKAEAGSLAEQLMVQGQAELRTLAGGISITPEGLAILGISVATPHSEESGLHLSDGPTADDSDRRTVYLLMEEIKKEIPGLNLEYGLLEEIVVDLKTIEVHLLSPRPKISVLREIFRSLQNALATTAAVKVVAQLKTII